MRKGKSRTRIARRDMIRGYAKIAARKTRQHFDRQAYDKPQSADPSPT